MSDRGKIEVTLTLGQLATMSLQSLVNVEIYFEGDSAGKLIVLPAIRNVARALMEALELELEDIDDEGLYAVLVGIGLNIPREELEAINPS